VRIHVGRSSTLDNGKPHGAHLIACMKRLLPERRDEQFHQIRPDVPGVSELLEFQESIALVPRHFQGVFAERQG
jgi:hypothetical protein